MICSHRGWLGAGLIVLVIGASSGLSGSRALLTHIASPHRVPLSVIRAPRAHHSSEVAAVDAALEHVHRASVDLSGDHRILQSALACRRGSEYAHYAADHGDYTCAVDEVDAQIRYSKYIGAFPSRGSAVLCDVGSAGTTLSVVDLASSTVVESRRTSVLSGNDVDYSLKRHLALRGVTADVVACRDAKERLQTTNVVTVSNTDNVARCVVTRRDFEMLIASAVGHCAMLLRQLITLSRSTPATLVVVGGGGNIGAIVRIFEAETGISATVLPTPELVAARGAALLSAVPRAAGPYVLTNFG